MSKHYLLSLLSLIPSFLLAINSLVINEILFKQSSQNQEWIEIYNTGEIDVNIDGFYVEDAAKNVTKINGIIAPKQYRVICSDKKKMLLFYPFLKDEQVIQASSWAVLNNDKETLCLKDKTGAVIDSVSYKAKSSHPNDLSLERANPYDPNSSWDLCRHSDLSTPAWPNSILPLKYDIEIIKAKNAQVDDLIEHTVIFRNVGLEMITEFTLNCYAYNENNAVGELIFYEEYFAIEDSLSFVTQQPTSGYVSYEYEIKSDLDENNLKEYGVIVHSIKSTSATIGVMTVSSKALLLENAAKEGDRDQILIDHPAMIEEYEKIVNLIKKVVPDSPAKNDEEIMEFSPEV